MVDSNEFLNDFLQDITSINGEILEVLKSLNENIDQPNMFLKFSNLVDRIYDTAATLGHEHLAQYCQSLKQVSRKTGNSEVKRMYPPMMKLMLNYTSNFVVLKQSLEDRYQKEVFTKMISVDMKKMENLEREVFTFVDKKHGLIK